MKKLAFKFVILVAPFAALIAIELFVLPIQYFTFRNWEALLALNVRPAAGPFYPDMHIKRSDERGYNLKFADTQPKTVEWYTDHDGYRNRPRPTAVDRYDIVVVGDSNIAGSYLDQKDTLSEVLERKCGCATFSYSSVPKNSFFFDWRFQEHPPRAVVVEIRTGEIYQEGSLLFNFNASVEKISSWTLSYVTPPSSPLPHWLAILEDRFLKENMLQYVRSRLRLATKVGDLPEREISVEQRTEFLFKLATAMDQESRRRDTQFVLLVIPQPPFDRTLDEAIVRLKESGVKVIAYLPNDKHSDWANIDNFFSNRDPHWREQTVVEVADKVLGALTAADETNPKADKTSLESGIENRAP
jgi:hypothetical protein